MPGFELFDEIEKKHLQDVIDSGVLMRYGFSAMRNGHWKAKEMEAAICKTANVNHALLLSSGTAAITTALVAMGVGEGDEVIMPPFTFVASFESVMMAGATPILVDIDDTLCLDPEAVRKAITPRTKVIMPVHMCGSMAQIDQLLDICAQHKLLLLEDACQAFGASFHGKPVGSIGDAGCYSFDFNKIITCGEGGAVVTNNADYYAKMDMYHDHGHDHSNDDRGAEGHPYLGFNYRISELNAAVGCGQINKLCDFVGIHRRNKKILKDALSTIPQIKFRRLPDPEGDSGTFLSFFLPTLEQTRAASLALKSAGVDGVFHWFDNNWHYIRNWDHFKENKFLNPISKTLLQGLPVYAPDHFKQSDAIMSCTLSASIRMSWTPEQVNERAEKMVKAILSVIRN